MAQITILDPPDVKGVFFCEPEDVSAELFDFDYRALSEYMKNNNIILKPGEMLDDEIVDMFKR